MNEKWFSLPEDRQLAIINAGYQVFGTNSYSKASIADVAEAAGISKALLFHYFTTKFGLYTFLWNHAEAVTATTKQKHDVFGTDNFFEMLRRGLAAKCEIMRKYPYMTPFSCNALYEENTDVRDYIQSKIQTATENSFALITPFLNKDLLRKDVSFESIYKETIYASEGLVDSWYRRKDRSVDSFEAEYLEMIHHWETVYAAPAPQGGQA